MVEQHLNKGRLKSFTLICLICHMAFLIFFFKVSIWPLVFLNTLSVITYIIIYFKRFEKEQNEILAINYELLFYATISTVIVGYESCFFLYGINTLNQSPFMLNQSKKRKIFIIHSIIALLLMLLLEYLLKDFFAGYHEIMVPYNSEFFRINLFFSITTLLSHSFFKSRQNEDLSKTIEFQAQHDILTGAYNRVYANEFFEEKGTCVEAHRDSVLMLDIDNFKHVNDTYGHQTGDTAIRFVANSLKEITDNSCLVTRWGGEEFVVLLCGYSIEDASKKAEEIRRHIEKTPYVHNLFITVSIGATEVKAGEEYISAIARADENMYAAKTSGKNKVVRD